MTILALTTLADVKALMQSPATSGLDALISSIITAVSQRLEDELGRKLNLEQRTERLSPMPFAQILVLGAAPVTEPDANTGLPVFELRESASRDFTVDPIDASTYYLDPDAGLVHYDGQFCGVKGSVQVIYTAGLAADTATLKTNYPAIWQAATFWAKEIFDKRNQLGRSGESVSGTSISWNDGLGDVPDIVATLIAPYRRVVACG